MVDLVTANNEDDLMIKNEGTRVLTTLNNIFFRTQSFSWFGQMQYLEILWLSLFLPRMMKIQSKFKGYSVETTKYQFFKLLNDS